MIPVKPSRNPTMPLTSRRWMMRHTDVENMLKTRLVCACETGVNFLLVHCAKGDNDEERRWRRGRTAQRTPRQCGTWMLRGHVHASPRRPEPPVRSPAQHAGSGECTRTRGIRGTERETHTAQGNSPIFCAINGSGGNAKRNAMYAVRTGPKRGVKLGAHLLTVHLALGGEEALVPRRHTR